MTYKNGEKAMNNKDVITVLHDLYTVFSDLNSDESLIISDHELINTYKEAFRSAILSLEYTRDRNALIEMRAHRTKRAK